MANAFFLSPQYTEMAGALIVGEMKMNGRCTKVGTEHQHEAAQTLELERYNAKY